MIITAEPQDVKESAPTVHYRAQGPDSSTMTPSSPVSLVKEGDEIVLQWGQPQPVADAGIAQKLVSELIASARRAVERYPGSSKAHTNLGLALLNSGDTPHAIGEFTGALNIDPDNYVAGTQLAKLFVAQNRLDDADSIYRHLRQIYPRHATPLMSLAYIAMRREKFEEAERLFRDVIGLGVKSPIPFYNLAVLLLRRGETREAISKIKAALRENPRSPALYEALGIAYSLSGNTERSARAFSTTLTLAPGRAEAIRGLANTLLKANQPQTAIEVLVKYLDKVPDDMDARLILARAYTLENRPSAARTQFLAVFNHCLPSSGDVDTLSELSNDIGVTFFAERNFNETEAWFSRSISYSSAHGVLPYRNLARTYITQGKYKQAFETVQQARALFHSDEDLALMFAFLRGRSGAYDEAIAELRPFALAGTSNVEVYVGLSWLLADCKHEYEQALQLLRSAYERFPGERVLANNLGYVYLMVGDTVSAIAVLEHIKSAIGSDVAATATWGLLFLKQGRQEEAKKLYQLAVSLAFQLGNRELANTVRQKMHLEFAKLFLAEGDLGRAGTELNLGLAVGEGRTDYMTDLLALRNVIETQH